VVQMCPNFYK